MADPDPRRAARGPAAATGRLPAIDPQRCTGCGRCVAACGPHLLSLEVVHWKKRAVLHGAQACTHCSACAVVCPFHAITMRRGTTPAADAGGAGGVSAPG